MPLIGWIGLTLAPFLKPQILMNPVGILFVGIVWGFNGLIIWGVVWLLRK